jgi:hypothetical protein
MIENEYRVRRAGAGFEVMHTVGDSNDPVRVVPPVIWPFATLKGAEFMAMTAAALDPAKALFVTFQGREPSRIIFPALFMVPDDYDVAAEFQGGQEKVVT